MTIADIVLPLEQEAFAAFARECGGFHDATLKEVKLLDDGSIALLMGRTFANFDGFPEYPGEFAAVIRLSELQDRPSVIALRNAWIADFEVQKTAGQSVWHVLIRLNDGAELEWHCSRIALMELTESAHGL